MTSEPRVSIIVPVYNAEEYLEDCLESVLGQTLTEIEVVCVNDGSTDDSLGKLRQLAASDSRIKVLSQDNQGAGPARNYGMDNATGEYVAFMDPDDWYPDNQVLERLYRAAKQHGADICGGSLVECINGELSNDYSRTKVFFKFDQEGYISYSDYQYDFGYQRFLYSVSLLNDGAIRFPNYRRFQDPPFFVKAMISAEKFYAMPQPSYVYRVGYRELKWDEEKISGFVNGMCDVISLAAENNLNELLSLELGRLRNNDMNLLFRNLQVSEMCQSTYGRLAQVLESVESDLAPAAFALVSNSRVMAALDVAPEIGDASGDPAVSVIVPAYNSADYLPDCIASLRCQTLKNIEIIIVNDGSTDGTADLLLALPKEDGRLIVLEQENKGQSSARNAGLEVAKGKYVCFVDSDDMLKSDALARLYRICEENELEELFYSAVPFYSSLELVESQSSFATYYDYRSFPERVMTGQDLFVLLRENNEFKPSACLQIFNREFLRTNGIEFREGILHEDNLFTIESLSCSTRSAVLPEPLYVRRLRPGSIMTTQKSVKNAYGYYHVVVDAALFFRDQQISLTHDFARSVAVQNSIMLDMATSYCLDTSDEKLAQFVDQLETCDKLLFEAMVVGRMKKASTISEQSERIRSLEAKVREQSRSLKRIRSSYSFRAGRMFTALPRKLKKMIKGK